MGDNDEANDVEGTSDSASPRRTNAAKSKTILGVPYDWRAPTTSRVKSRLYNSGDPRLFPPKAFGVGWTINFYWIVHPAAYVAKKRTR